MNEVYEKFGHPTRYLKRLLMRRQRGACADCGVQEYDLDRSLQAHRLVKDGRYDLDNCILLCHPCHSKRHNREKVNHE